MQKVSATLAKVYKAKGGLDSAAKYFELALSYNEIINSMEKKRALQTHEFDEQLRVQEAEETKNKMKIYALLAGLGVLLVIVLISLLNIRQRKKQMRRWSKRTAK